MVNDSEAGASARREYERRLKRDQEKVAAERERLQNKYGGGSFGKFVAKVAVDDTAKQTTSAWKQGAEGEAALGRLLNKHFNGEGYVLHDRLIPGSRANIDHIVVTEAGVWVIDTKRYRNKRPSFYVEGGFLGFGARTGLKVAGRKQDRLVDGVLKQVALVKETLASDVPVHGVLCFVDADWPLIGGAFSVRGVRVFWPKRLIRVIQRSETAAVDHRTVGEQIASIFKAA